MQKLIDLDECVLNALDLFEKEKLPKIDIKFKKPLVVGSGNAAVTGKIMFSDREAVFADEGTYLKKLKTIQGIDGCILISASGKKHAPIIAKELKKRKIPVILLTHNKEAEASKYVSKTYYFPKNPEPYTYNTSTYIGLILSKTKEDPRKIKQFLKTIKVPNVKKFDSFYILVPEEFDSAREMFQTKFDELFGPIISARIFTIEQTKHAKTVVKSDKELFIGLGVDNKLFGKNKINFKLPKDASFGACLAIGYYIIGKIQKQNKPYFKENIEMYTKEASKLFNTTIDPIVK